MLKIPLVYFSIFLASTVSTQPFTPYHHEIEQWKLQRLNSLKSENGWLNLVGLFWLEEGKNSFGTASSNNIVFPKKSIPSKAGYFIVKNQIVLLYPAKGVNIKVNNQLAKPGNIIFSKDTAKPTLLSFGSFHWAIIKREDKIGIRLRDFNSSLVKSYKGADRFPTDSNWRFEAILTEPLLASTIPIVNVLGQTVQMKFLGKLVFTINKQIYSLDAVEEEGQLFVIFADDTNNKESYGAGRFLYALKPDSFGKTIIDFNKAFNPPCAFTPFATCPLPPKQNRLNIAIRAGEKNYKVY